jgi:hypothetical protein
MNVEVHVSEKSLAVRFNGVFSPTDRGHLAHELVRIDSALKKDADPKIEFSISDKMRQGYLERKEELCGLLGVPSEGTARERTINGYNGYLAKVGLPYYRINLNQE